MWVFAEGNFKQTWLKITNHWISRAYNQILFLMTLALLNYRSIKRFGFQLIQQQPSLFSKTFPKFTKSCLLLQEYLPFKQNNFSNRLAITIFIFLANCYLNKTRLTSSKNIYQIIDLIEFIIIYNLPEYFTVFHSTLLRIILCFFYVFWIYHIAFLFTYFSEGFYNSIHLWWRFT